MSLFSRFFYRRPPDGLLEFVERVYVFDSCFSTEVLPDGMYQIYLHEIVTELYEVFPDSNFLAFNFREGEKKSQFAEILCEYGVTILDYPRQYEGCPILPLSLIQHFLRVSENWLSLRNHQNVILLHCERGGWPLLAFLLASFMIFRNSNSGEQRTLENVHREAPKGLLKLLSPLKPYASQVRYLHYIARRNISPEWPPTERALSLDCLILRAIPSFDAHNGCRPIIRVFGRNLHSKGGLSTQMIFSMTKKKKSLRHYRQGGCDVIKIDIQCLVQGDVVLECLHLDMDPEREVMMFRIMFNTAFIRSNILMLNSEDLDILWDSKKRYPKNFRAEVLFGEVESMSTPRAPTTTFHAEEKGGLPIEAFSRVQELFSGVDWVDSDGDAALWLLKQLSANALQEKIEQLILNDGKEFSRSDSRGSFESSFIDSEEERDEAKGVDPMSLEPEKVLHAEDPMYMEEPFNDVTCILHPSNEPPNSSIVAPQIVDVTPSSPSHHQPSSTYIQSSPSSIVVSSLPLPLPPPPPPPPPPTCDRGPLPSPPSSLPLPLAASNGGLPPPTPSQLQATSCQTSPPLPSPPPPCTTSSGRDLLSPLPSSVGVVPLQVSSNRSPSPPLQEVISNKGPPPPPPPPPSLPLVPLSRGPPAAPPPPPLTSLVSSSRDPPPPPPPISSMSCSRGPPPPPPPPPPLITHVESSLAAQPSTTIVTANRGPPPPPPLPPTSEGPPPPPPPPLSSIHVGKTPVAPPPLPPPPPSFARVDPPNPPPFPLDTVQKGPAPPPPPSAPKPPSGMPPPPPLQGGNRGSQPGPSPPPGAKMSSAPAPPPLGGGRGRASLGSMSGRGRGAAGAGSASQKQQFKPFHWGKVTRVVQGSLWADNQTQGNETRAPEIDMSELASLFSAASTSGGREVEKVGTRKGSTMNKPEIVHLVDLRRANNCEIMLTKIKMPLSEMISAVLALDSSVLDIDQVENLIKFCPTKEEVDMLKNYTGNKEMLGRCEQFFLELMKVPRVESKLRVFSFTITFASQVKDLRANLNTINDASREVRDSIKLRQIMQTILTLGNALNQGTARGSALGFKLDSLLKLSDTRARNNKMTLMHYLCKLLAEKMPELLDFDKDLVHLEAASKIQLKSLAEEMQAVSKGLEKVEQELTASDSDGAVSKGFQKALKGFLHTAEAEVRSLISLYSEVGRNADSLAQYFGEDPARCPFEQVTSILVVFVNMFNKAREENVKMAEAEKKKLEKEAMKEKTGNSSAKKEKD